MQGVSTCKTCNQTCKAAIQHTECLGNALCAQVLTVLGLQPAFNLARVVTLRAVAKHKLFVLSLDILDLQLHERLHRYVACARQGTLA